MKELKIKTKSSLKDFITSKGFCLSLAISLTLFGFTIWSLVNKSIDKTINKNIKIANNSVNQNTKLRSVDNIINNIPIENQTNSQPNNKQKSLGANFSEQHKNQNLDLEDNTEVKTETDLEKRVKSENNKNTLFVTPITGKIVNDYSNNELVKNKTLCDWRVHNGIDISAPQGTPVKAIADGEIIKVYSSPLLGVCIEIEHDNNLNSIYCGLNKNINVKEGDLVEAADIIASVGNTATGESELGPHLHLEIKENGEKINPLSKIKIS